MFVDGGNSFIYALTSNPIPIIPQDTPGNNGMSGRA